MPKVALTEAQRREHRIEKRGQLLADGLASFKNRNRLSNENLAAELEIGRNSVANILSGCCDVKISIRKMFLLLEIAGIDLVPKEPKA